MFSDGVTKYFADREPSELANTPWRTSSPPSQVISETTPPLSCSEVMVTMTRFSADWAWAEGALKGRRRRVAAVTKVMDRMAEAYAKIRGHAHHDPGRPLPPGCLHCGTGARYRNLP